MQEPIILEQLFPIIGSNNNVIAKQINNWIKMEHNLANRNNPSLPNIKIYNLINGASKTENPGAWNHISKYGVPPCATNKASEI